MTRIIRLFAFLAGLLPAVAAAQSPPLPANTVWGRLGIGAGPGEAIPFAVLSSKLSGAIITLNSGNGQTAPGAMSGGNTYSFGANTDTVRMTGLGLGGAAPATGLQVYNAPVNPGAGGQGSVGASSVNGGGLIGQGSVFDSFLGNNSGSVALGVTTGTQNIVLNGTLTGASLSTVGTIAGSICRTSGGLFLYEVGVNCFAVSGVSIANGKVLTVNNTLTFNGTDSTTFTYPGATDTLAGLGANQTFTGTDTFSGTLNITGTGQLNGTAFGTFATQNFATPPAIGGTTPNTGAFSTLSATTPIGISSGGTNANTAAGGRAATGLNVESYTAKGDTNYSMVATDRTVATSATLTAARTWTLPAASAVNPGSEIVVTDMVGGVTNTNTLTIARNGSDTVNGGTSVAISVSNGAYLLRSDGVSKWTAQQLGAQATVGVSSINGQTGNPSIVAGTGMAVSTSGGNISVAMSSARQTLPTKQVFTSSSGTYTTPANVIWIEITLVGGGGGGGGGNNATPGTSGGATCWNTTGAACSTPVYSAGGGVGANNGTAPSGTGGTISGSGTCDWSVAGGNGNVGTSASSSAAIAGAGGIGGSSSLGGAGAGSTSNSAAVAAVANSGSGGGGGGAQGASNALAGAGGGAGATCHVIINNPAATYTYAVGAAGSGASAGTSAAAGSNGAAGQIIVYEHYNS